MDNTVSGSRRQNDDTLQSPSPPKVMSKSTSISQSGSHRATTGPTLQARPSATMARKALSDERLNSAAGAGAASQRREPRPTDNQTTAHPAAASRGRQATTEQFDVELDARSRAGKPPLDADNTQNVSAYKMHSSKSSSISASKETRTSQREDITNSKTTASASPIQLPVHLVTNSPSSRNALPSRALRDNNSSNISLPGPEETRERNESPHPQEDSESRSQRTIIRPHAERVNRTASVQSSVKPPTSYHPPPSSGERRGNTSHAEQVDRVASIQPPDKPPIPSKPSSTPVSSSERNVTRPHADPVNRTASSSVQPSIKPSIPYLPPFSSSERNVTRPHADPVNRTASSSVQSSIKPFATYSPPLSSATAHAMAVNDTRPPLNLQGAAMPLPPSPAQALARMASNRMHSLEDKGNVRSDEQARNDPSAASRISAAPPKPTPATTKPPRQDHKASSAVPQAPPITPDHIPTTTDLPSQQDRKVPATSDRPPVRSEHTPATTVSPLRDPKDTSAAPSSPPVLPKHTPAMTVSSSLQNPKDTSAAPSSPPVLPKHTPTTTVSPSLGDPKNASAAPSSPPALPSHTPATTVLPSLQDPKGASTTPPRPPVLPKDTSATTGPPLNSLSQPVSGPSGLNRSKSGIRGNEGGIRGAERAMEGSSSVREEQNRVPAPERENRLKDSANAKPKPTTGHAEDVPQNPRAPAQSSLQRTHSSYRSRGNVLDTNDSRHTGDRPPMRVAGDEPQKTQRHQAMSISPFDERKAQQRAGSWDMANGSGERVQREKQLSYDNDNNNRDPLLVKIGQRMSIAGSPGDSSDSEWDEPIHPEAAHGRSHSPSIERDKPTQSMDTITSRKEATVVGSQSSQETFSETNVNPPRAPSAPSSPSPPQRPQRPPRPPPLPSLPPPPEKEGEIEFN